MGPLLFNVFLCLIRIASANIFEYEAETQPLRPCELQREKAFQRGEDYIPQCAEDGQFRNMQCNKNGDVCWCVDDKGAEVPGSRQSGLSPNCLSFCQLERQRILVSRYVNNSATSYIPQCLDSGDFDPIQCDLGLVQCWCVDAEGMEIYGTRQKGKPKQCPGKCEIRDRRILHGVGEKSPPQCSSDGEFLQVQCKFINTTDRMVFDLVHHFSRFSEAFLMFSSFRQLFSEISGYCYCADSLGRELEDTGLEMLLDNVYDTVFASLDPVPTFTETSMYRILQRRFLGVQLATSGRFRCPSKCETERSATIRFGQNYQPLCDGDGAYQPTQCQRDGECWCVDAKGQELPGTRRKGQHPICGQERACISERQESLPMLFYGPIGHFSQHSFFSTSQDLQNRTMSSRSCPPSFKELFVESGLLSSVLEKMKGSQLLTLESILSEAVGGMFPSRELAQVALQFTSNPQRFQENLFGGKFLKNLAQFNFTGTVGSNGKVNLDLYLQQTKTRDGGTDLNQTLVDSYGRTIKLQDNQNAIQFLASLLEAPEFFTFLEHVISFPESITQDLGEVVKIVLKTKDCTEQRKNLFVPACTKEGRYEEMQCYAGDCWCVGQSGKEILGTRVQGGRPKCPTMCEKQRGSLQRLRKIQPAGSELFIPSCTQEGKFLPVQCLGINCFCVNSEGRTVPEISANTGESIKCPSDCQLAAGQAVLHTVQQLFLDPNLLPQLSDIYIPQCSLEGQWRRVQCSGPPEQAFEWYQRWSTQNNNGRALPFTNLVDTLLNYKQRSQQSFEDFIKILYEDGHQNIFPELSEYPSFDTVPQAVLEGKTTVRSSENVLLKPLSFWQLLQANLIHYPGSYMDFSTPLGHFDLRSCWCVDEKGQMQGNKADVNKVPDCPGECEAAKRDAMQFLDEVEQIITESNRSRFPFGQSFLMAKVVTFTDDELLSNLSQLSIAFSEKLLAGNDYAIRLAAQSTLQFYQRSLLMPSDSAKEILRLGFQPYLPQCDGLGNWQPVQCYDSSGHCWCVDEKGRYIADSLVARSTYLPQCQTSCQRAQANALISSWRLNGQKLNNSSADLFTPSCLETGDYAGLQLSDTQAWCVDPASGEVFQQSSIDSSSRSQCPGYCSVQRSKAILWEIGRGYIPQCTSEGGTFSLVQCTEGNESCFCVFESGEEAPGTRVKGKRPSCERPQCPLPFDAPITVHGSIFCNTSAADPKIQQCQVICASGFESAFLSNKMLLCDTKSRLWIGDPPHSLTCQRLQPFQSVQTQAQFQLLLPPEKACSPDYSGLLETFQIFILDEMKAHGFCHIQVHSFEHSISVPICDDSSIRVECLAADILGVNVTWKALLEDIPAASLPDLRNIEKAMVGENLLGRFEALIRRGGFALQLDNKQFKADTSITFFKNGDFAAVPQVQLGCQSGFQKVLSIESMAPNIQGCVACPPGTFFQNDSCVPCPSGFYQDQARSLLCVKCPVGKSTISVGAFSVKYCLTNCQRDERSMPCDENGQYRHSYRNLTTKQSFCIDSLGEILEWTETEGQLTDSQCLVLRRFEKISATKLSFTTDEAEIIQSQTIQGEFQSALQKCVAECEQDELCGFLTLSAVGTKTLCELYSAQEKNYNCSASGLVEGTWGNPVTSSVAQLSCVFKVRSQDQSAVGVYLKKGHEFNTAGAFEITDFQDVVSGVYRNLAVSATGTSLTDVHLFCRQACSEDVCCDGFILIQTLLDGGGILCGLMSDPDVLMCNIKDWDGSSTRDEGNMCQRVKYSEGKKQYTFTLGGQVLTGTSEAIKETEDSVINFQRVYLWRNSNMLTRTRPAVCDTVVLPTETKPFLPAFATEHFSLLENAQILIEQNRPLPSQQYWLFKPRFSAEQARLWCLARCTEDDFCHMVDIPNVTTSMFFPCTLYPAAQVCDNTVNNIPDNCKIVLPQRPQLLYQKKVSLEGSVKNFYTRLPFRKMSSISVNNKMDVSGKIVSNGFFDCERLCDADPCCSGFGFLNVSQGTGGKVLCLALSSLGVQTCSEEITSDWRVSNCTSLQTEPLVHPFGWYQKGATVPRVCPPVPLPERQGNVTLDKWKRVDRAAILIDSSILKFDTMHVSRDTSSDFGTIRDFCLSVCSKEKLCLVTTLEVQPAVVRCVFYPETQICTLDLQGHHCQLLLKEPATYIYRKQDAFQLAFGTKDTPSVFIPPQGTLSGISQVIQVGSSWKRISQFLGVPYAARPVGANRFRPPQTSSWAGSWNATSFRASCWQPGDGEPSPLSVSEDCLYLNIYIPENTGGTLPVLVFFHNGLSNADNQARRVIDGSYLAAVGNLIVITANYRVGVFGFLSTGSSAAVGNWGILDQEAVLKWTQQNIAYFGGDPSQISVAADGSGADVTSLHLFAGSVAFPLFKRMVLMGGSAFSPVSTISKEKAGTHAAVLARELGCPSDGSEEMVSCLRQLSAKVLNDAQTRLLAISGPFQYWSPVLDGFYLQESLTATLQRPLTMKVDLFIGSTQQDGLISRAKAIKRFEESQGRGNSKTAFYQALQNSLGGEDGNPIVQAAATWFYSLQHSSTEYASFSRALENATRDHFIICPTIEMARHWASNDRGNVFMYHVPESDSLSSSSLEFLPDIQYVFGLPFHPQYQSRYPQEEKTLSLAVMQYLANFVKSGNPNVPYKFSRKGTGIIPPWPMFRADTGGDNYKEFTTSLENRKGLKEAECSFWIDYIQPLKASASFSGGREQPVTGRSTKESEGISKTTQMKPLGDKVAYSK